MDKESLSPAAFSDKFDDMAAFSLVKETVTDGKNRKCTTRLDSRKSNA
jgi:hypothetical protein